MQGDKERPDEQYCMRCKSTSECGGDWFGLVWIEVGFISLRGDARHFDGLQLPQDIVLYPSADSC